MIGFAGLDFTCGGQFEFRLQVPNLIPVNEPHGKKVEMLLDDYILV